jgi:hypothetical protein
MTQFDHRGSASPAPAAGTSAGATGAGKSSLTAQLAGGGGGGGGAALPGGVREQFETSLCTDLGGVRVHTGPESNVAAASMNAQAFATGSDIHFAAGKYQPDDPFGLHLLAHEVAHTQQPQDGTPMAKREVSDTGDAAEVEADAAADAMVAGRTMTLSASRTASIHRAPEAKSAATTEKTYAIGEANVPAHALSGEEQKDLEWARTVAKRASKNFDHAVGALGDYAETADETLEKIQSTFDGIATMTNKAYKQVNETIGKYQELEKIQSEVLSKVLGAVITGAGGVTGIAEQTGALGKLKAMNDHANYSWTRVTKAKLQMSALQMAGDNPVKSGDMGGLVEGGKTVVDSGKELGSKATEGGGGGGGGLAEPWVKELAFYKSLTGLHKESTKLMKVAVGLAEVGKPIGTLERAILDVGKANKTDPAYPIARMKKDAQKYFEGTSDLADGVEHIPGLLADMKAVLAQLQGATSTQKQLEKELWIQWMSGMDGSDKALLATSGLRDYIRKAGVWTQLGIDPGTWFSDDEQSTVVCMANAQTKVLAHKGVTISPTNKIVTTPFGNSEMLAVRLGDLPELPAKVVEGPKVPTYAQVVGVEANREIDDKILEGVKGKEAITERILKNRYLTVHLKGLKDKDND